MDLLICLIISTFAVGWRSYALIKGCDVTFTNKDNRA